MGAFWIREYVEGVRFELRAGNGIAVASGRCCETVGGCRREIRELRKCGDAPLEDRTEKTAKEIPGPKFRLGRDEKGLFRFSFVGCDGRTIAVGGPYRSKAACLKGIDSVRRNAEDAPVWEM